MSAKEAKRSFRYFVSSTFVIMTGASGGMTPSHRKESTGGSLGGSWGPASSSSRGGPGAGGPSYSSITSINTSIRDNKNILEVRLEKQQGSTFNLSMLETENLLRRLSITHNEFAGVSACPEGRPVVFITLNPTVNITRFLYRNESYVVKEGVRTTTIRQEGKKEKLLKITGLHPNTKDQAVFKYLSAHGTVSTKDKVIHHVFPGEPGTSLLAGKLNGNRSYVVELKAHMGSYHIIDGEKVSVRYSGQEWTCARCHQLKRNCPGAAVARNCTADRVLLSDHMSEHWQKIGYRPETDALNEVDDMMEIEVQVGGKKQETLVIPESNLTSKYKSIIVKGFKPDTPIETIMELLSEHGGPEVYQEDDVVRNVKTGNLTVSNLKPEECLTIMENMNRNRFFKRQIFVTSIVPDSPVKTPSDPANSSLPKPTDVAAKPVFVDPETGAKNKDPPAAPKVPSPDSNPNSKSSSMAPPEGFSFGLVSPGVQDRIQQMENLKRKSEASPEENQLSKKEKKMLREEERRLKKVERKQEMKDRKAELNKTS